MSEKKWGVDLTEAERAELRGLIRKGKAAARRLTRAHILRLADEGRTDEQIAAALHPNRSTAERVRHRFVEEGLEAALDEKPRPGATPALDARGEAVQLLGRRAGRARRGGAISDETGRRPLKKSGGRPGCASAGACPR